MDAILKCDMLGMNLHGVTLPFIIYIKKMGITLLLSYFLIKKSVIFSQKKCACKTAAQIRRDRKYCNDRHFIL